VIFIHYFSQSISLCDVIIDNITDRILLLSVEKVNIIEKFLFNFLYFDYFIYYIYQKTVTLLFIFRQNFSQEGS
jgi:hypothetical protein